jgi:branched-chain amino acid transport system substrate-binding protein
VRAETSPPWEHSWTFTFSIADPAPAGSIWDKPGYTIKDTWKSMLDLFGPQTNKKAGVFASDEPDGRGWYASFPPMLKEWGYDVIGMEKNLGLFPMETTDFSSIIKEWKDNNVEVLWGNCPGPVFGIMWKQARPMGFKPKIVYVGRAALYYEDVSAWGGDLPWGIGTEIWWDPTWKECPGIGGTTPMTLYERWVEDTERPLDPGIGWGYHAMQILFDAIERAGSLDSEKVSKSLGETDMATISTPRLKFDENHSARMPLVFGQWYKTDKPWTWECPIVFSKHDWAPAQAKPLFPVPYD